MLVKKNCEISLEFLLGLQCAFYGFIIGHMIVLFGSFIIQAFLYVVGFTVDMDAIRDSETVGKIAVSSALLGTGIGFYVGFKTEF
jgi:hypothetical protein